MMPTKGLFTCMLSLTILTEFGMIFAYVETSSFLPIDTITSSATSIAAFRTWTTRGTPMSLATTLFPLNRLLLPPARTRAPLKSNQPD